MSEKQKNAQMVRVAELYYRHQMSQQQIAKTLGCSHSTVSRLLSDARRTGVVEITIRRDFETVPELSDQIRSVFGLLDTIVVPSAGSEEKNLESVGAAAADLLLSIVSDGMSIGVTWGETLYHVVNAIDDVPLEDINVVQMTGALGNEGDPEIDGPKLAIKLAERFGGSYTLVPAPAIVETPELRDTLINEPSVRTALKHAKSADIMVQGVGALSGGKSGLESAGYLNASTRKKVKSKGAVGHVVARMIDADGVELKEFGQRVISIPLDAMRDAKWSIGIIATPIKVEAMIAAIKGGYFNAIVVDEDSAKEMLQLKEVIAA